jgi:asparagine N-glycosylation enzyme membrane subunit Stt3
MEALSGARRDTRGGMNMEFNELYKRNLCSNAFWYVLGALCGAVALSFGGVFTLLLSLAAYLIIVSVAYFFTPPP